MSRGLRWQPRDQYPSILQASDLGLANSPRPGQDTGSAIQDPQYHGCQRPVVAVMDLQGDAPKLIEEAHAGVCLALRTAPSTGRGHTMFCAGTRYMRAAWANGRSYAEQQTRTASVAARYEQILGEIRKASI